jgi:hypothetical protein
MDVLHDKGHRLWVQLGTKHAEAIPDYVLEYQLPEEKEAQDMPDRLFADSHRRLFPIDSPAATWLSAAYFSKRAAANELPYNAGEAEYVKGLLLKAADLYDIENDAVKISHDIVKLDIPDTPQPEQDDSNYGWVMKAASGEILARKYPMFDERGVEKAAAYFDEYRARYPLNVRRHISHNILRKAAEYGVDTDNLPGSVMREAGFGLPQRDVVMSEMLRRAKLTKDAEASLALANINLMISELDNTEFGHSLDKLAEVLDDFDRGAELTQHYGTRLRMPADFLYDVPLKQAEDAVAGAILLDQYAFSAEKLAALDPTVFTDVLGDSVVRDMSTDEKLDQQKVADVLPTLPRPDKVALEEHLVSLFNN